MNQIITRFFIIIYSLSITENHVFNTMVLTMVLRRFGDGFDNDFDDGLTMVRQWFGDAFSDGLLVC